MIKTQDADVLVLSDGSARWDVLGALRGVFLAADWPLDSDIDPIDPTAIVQQPLVIDVDLSQPDNYNIVRSKLRRHKGGRLALLTTHNRRNITRAHELGAHNYHVHPVDEVDLCLDLQALLNRRAEDDWGQLNATQKSALRISLRCFEECMGNAAGGLELPVEAVKSSTQHIISATKGLSLDQWMDSLRSHHNYTFRHSMMTSGVVATFAQLIGIGGRDLELLTSGGLLHDLGKAKIAPSLLNKAGELNEVEWALMRRHPEHARSILENDRGLAREVADVVIHHHEAIDGSGYPLGLKGSEVNDYMRMVTIADVFAALRDKRPYKPAYSKVQALDIMEGMKGQLDQSLVRAFKEIILD